MGHEYNNIVKDLQQSYPWPQIGQLFRTTERYSNRAAGITILVYVQVCPDCH
jgi:hypothetical protein